MRSKTNSVPSHTKVAIPKLLAYGGRTQEAVETAFNYFQKNSCDDNLFALMSEHSLQSPSAYPYRGFLMYNRENNLEPIREIQVHILSCLQFNFYRYDFQYF